MSVAAVVAFSLFTVLFCASSLNSWNPREAGWFQTGFDFNLRYSELKCLRMGYNPYDVWTHKVDVKPFYPHTSCEYCDDEHTEPIHAYVPWAYTYVLPLSFLPKRTAWTVHFLLMFVCLSVAVGVAFCIGRRLRGSVWDALLLSFLPTAVMFYTIWSNFHIGNNMMMPLAFSLLMMVCLNRGWDVLAGVCWAVAMIKPQIAVLFAVPLLMRGRVKTCAVAAGICLASTIPPALMCGTNPIELIAEAPRASAFAFCGSGTLPAFLFKWCGSPLGSVIAQGLGVVICCWLTHLVRGQKNWITYMMPAAACGFGWTYVQVYNHSFAWFYFFCLLVAIGDWRQSLLLKVLFALSCLFATRMYTCYHHAVSAFSNRLPSALQIPLSVHESLDTLNTTVVLLIVTVFCLWLKGRHDKTGYEVLP